MQRFLPLILLIPVVATGVATCPAHAQVRLDRADPSITEQALPKPRTPPAQVPTPTAIAPSVPDRAPMLRGGQVARAIVVDGLHDLSASTFADVLPRYIGNDLSREALTGIAGAVAAKARAAGYPFASATIEPQSLADGILHVTLDEGQITAVRVIGAVSPQADAILTHALVTGKAVRRADLERAIGLVGDIPGITVRDSKYTRQDGFGILIVTVSQDRASAYLQFDNRGSAEIGPLRATMLASVRGVAQSGDELGLIAALTPIQPSEFAFLRARYSAPVDTRGSIVTISGSYGRANPGALLTPLDVIGNSMDAAVGYTRPLTRSRDRSLWGNVELRALKSDQTLLGARLRNDRLATLTGSVNGAVRAGPGTLRGEVAIVGGLPVPGVTHQGDALTSRADGDARFAVATYTVDWTARLAGPFAMAIASSGQVASRPLLATMEIGAGGPAFGRAYDYAERTGDQGVLGSFELRANLGHVTGGIARLQLYGFVDGGYVDNLRNGVGGGSLLSSGTGARLGQGLFDGMIEVAFPLNADRFDTGTRRPRVSFRLSRSF